MSAQITGFTEIFRSFDQLGEVGRREASVAVAETAITVKTAVQIAIQTGMRSGVIYKRSPSQNLSATHKASAPGEAPATDTGDLAGSVHLSHNGLVSKVFSRLPKSFWLEYGTRFIAPRPVFIPTVLEHEAFLRQRLSLAMDRAVQAFNQ